MLRVSLLGNLGADPEVRFTSKGTQVVSFRVAVNQVRTGPDGERQENTEWFRIRVANRQSEYVQRLSKGTRVLVIGRLDIGHYQSKDGEPRTSFDVWADDVQGMSARGFGGEAEGLADGESEALEPAAAGVSSLAGAAAGASSLTGAVAGRGTTATVNGNANGSGKGTRAARPDPARGGTSGASEDLEDLPF